MTEKRKVLVAGESWTVHSIHQKGFDSFTTTEYSEGIHWLRSALTSGGWQVDYQPAHVAARDFPLNASALSDYGCVILSDIGANTLLLHPDTLGKSKILPNRLNAIRDYVAAGGGLVMVGGYLTFQGIEAKGQYAGSAVEDALPVSLQSGDDRSEHPEGATIRVVDPDHPVVEGLGSDWPQLLGYNRVGLKPSGHLVAKVNDDPLIAVGSYVDGRAVAFTSDCAPHWAPESFVDWSGNNRLWQQIASWAAGD